jgi:hypothetical protein
MFLLRHRIGQQQLSLRRSAGKLALKTRHEPLAVQAALLLGSDGFRYSLESAFSS